MVFIFVNKMVDKLKLREKILKFFKFGEFELLIREYRSKLVKVVDKNDFLVVVGEIGSGKII